MLLAVRARSSWGARPLVRLAATVTVSGEPSKELLFQQTITAGKHKLLADEPVSFGGTNTGPSPYDLLLSSLGACTSMTLHMYARKKGIPLLKVDVKLSHKKVYAEDCENCTLNSDKSSSVQTSKKSKIDKIDRMITLHGDDLTAEHRRRLLEIANLCPVHKTLETKNIIETTLDEQTMNVHTKLPNVEFQMYIPVREAKLSQSFSVKRIFPHRLRRSVGSFVFLDHMGPVSKLIDVGSHPHVGLCTLTYLYSGALHHKDSTGAACDILPGEVNW
jgi:putative redox protein